MGCEKNGNIGEFVVEIEASDEIKMDIGLKKVYDDTVLTNITWWNYQQGTYFSRKKDLPKNSVIKIVGDVRKSYGVEVTADFKTKFNDRTLKEEELYLVGRTDYHEKTTHKSEFDFKVTLE